MPSILHASDEKLAELREQFPGWRIWYVPNTGRGATWCAHPLPVLNCETPEDLAAAMTARAPEL